MVYNQVPYRYFLLHIYVSGLPNNGITSVAYICDGINGY